MDLANGNHSYCGKPKDVGNVIWRCPFAKDVWTYIQRFFTGMFISVLYITPIYRIYRRDKGEGDIFYGIYRDILNVSQHI
jgi:hypothetical protein